jgi:predicted nucleotidyltransferase
MEETGTHRVAVYQHSARQREQRRLRALAERRARAWQVAQAAAQILKERYGASRVLLFGSVVHDRGFHPESDIDLAAEGIAPADFWRAWAALDTIDTSFEINLIAVDEATPSLQAVLQKEGVVL